jgi:hypothetical protein
MQQRHVQQQFEQLTARAQGLGLGALQPRWGVQGVQVIPNREEEEWEVAMQKRGRRAKKTI